MFLLPFGLYYSACFGSLCPSSVHVVATFSGTVLFPLLCSVLPFWPNTLILQTLSIWSKKGHCKKGTWNKVYIPLRYSLHKGKSALCMT